MICSAIFTMKMTKRKQYFNDFGTVMDGKILCVGFSWDDYFKVEPLIDASYKKYKDDQV